MANTLNPRTAQAAASGPTPSSGLAGTRNARCMLRGALLTWLLITSGCGWLLQHRATQNVPSLPNPLQVSVTDQEFLWTELVDTLDDYFPLAREQRVRWVGDVMTEGRIETQPVTGATVMEFFRRDATYGFERWHGTFQSIRRQAEVRVIPSASGFNVQVIVRKELEDVDRPELATVGGAVQRHDGTLVRPQRTTVGGVINLGWIPQGRDTELEQKILADLYARLNFVEAPPPVQTLSDHH